MSEKCYEFLDFLVTICLGGGDGGDVRVSVPVSEEEYNALIEDGGEVYGDLRARIVAAAITEDRYCRKLSDEVINYEEASYLIELETDLYDEDDE